MLQFHTFRDLFGRPLLPGEQGNNFLFYICLLQYLMPLAMLASLFVLLLGFGWTIGASMPIPLQFPAHGGH